MYTKTTLSKFSIVTAWVFVLLASGLPRILLQEVFGYQVPSHLASGITAFVFGLGLGLSGSSPPANSLPLLRMGIVFLALLRVKH